VTATLFTIACDVDGRVGKGDRIGASADPAAVPTLSDRAATYRP
jgi:hypothetical protein